MLRLNNNLINNIFDYATIIVLCIYIFCIQLTESSICTIGQVSSVVNIIIRLTFLLIIIIDVVKVLIGNYTIKELIIYFFIGCLCVLVYVKSKSALPLLILLYNVAFKNTKYSNNIKAMLFTIILAMIIIVLSSVFFNLPDFTKLYYRYGIERYRYTIGYIFTSLSANYFLHIVLIYILLGKNKFIYLIFLVLNIILFVLTDTKYAFICTLFALILAIFLEKNKNKCIYDVFQISVIFSFIVCFFIILFLSLLYKYDYLFIKTINNFTTGRIELNYRGLCNWGVSAFGQVTNMTTNEIGYNFIDSSYISILVNNGVVILILILLFYTYYAFVAYKLKDIRLSIFLFIVAIHSVFDPQLIVICYNPIIVLFLYYYNKYTKIKKCNV